jgi:hypothetical protein
MKIFTLSILQVILILVLTKSIQSSNPALPSSKIVPSRRPSPIQTSIFPTPTTTIEIDQDEEEENVDLDTITQDTKPTLVEEVPKTTKYNPVSTSDGSNDELPTRLWRPRKRFGVADEASSSLQFSTKTLMVIVSLGFVILLY